MPDGLPPIRGIEHQIDFVPGASIPNRPASRSNPEETKELQRQVNELMRKYEPVRRSGFSCAQEGWYMELQRQVNAWIAEPLIISRLSITILYLDWMICWMNYMELQCSQKLI